MNNGINIKTLDALRNGDHKALEAVFIGYYERTKAFIYGYIKSEPDAEELTEELFINLWINRRSIDTSKSFDSYLHTIARNAAINYLKHQYVREAYLDSAQCPGYSSAPEEELIAKELGLWIDNVVDKMGKKRGNRVCRRVLDNHLFPRTKDRIF